MSNGAPRKDRLNRAVLIIDGQEYMEWESVQVRAAMYENTRTCRFTASEKEVPPSRSAMRIKPGQACKVMLDDQLAMTGFVITRTVSFSGNDHMVELQCQGQWGTTSGGAHVSQTGEYKNITVQQLAEIVGKPYGAMVEGAAANMMKFPRVSVVPGASAWETLEPYLRATQTPVSETAEGKLKLGVMTGSASVIEGWNILEGREVIHSLMAVGGSSVPGGQSPGAGEGTDQLVHGQRPGTDDSHGAQANQVNQEHPPITSELNVPYHPETTLSEVPAWLTDQMKSRGGFDAMYSDSLQIWVNCTLLTWQRSGKVPPAGGLWEPGDTVMVDSPMLILRGQNLKLKAVTWTQDNQSGTRSHIELVNDKAVTLSSVPGGVAPPSVQAVPPVPPSETTGSGPPPETGSPAMVRTWRRPR